MVTQRTGKIALPVSEDVEKRFRDGVFKRLGMKKGNIQVTIEEAIELWIKSKRT